jgi:hypothetical protein
LHSLQSAAAENAARRNAVRKIAAKTALLYVATLTLLLAAKVQKKLRLRLSKELKIQKEATLMRRFLF